MAPKDEPNNLTTPTSPPRAKLPILHTAEQDFNPILGSPSTWNTYLEEIDDTKLLEDIEEIKSHSLRIALLLAAPLYLINLCAFIWCLLIVPLTTITYPIYALCNGTKSLRILLINLLEPFIHINFSIIYVHEIPGETTVYSLAILLLLILSSPITSLLLSMYTIIACIFWIFTLCLGDPKNSNKEEKQSRRGRNMSEEIGKYNDGRNAIMFGRRCWRDLLSWAIS